ncbi:MAG: ketoacyl reductase, partial [Candidatus Udaeobacter sp.]
VLLHGIAPGFTADMLGVVAQLLPSAGGIGQDTAKGSESFSKASPSLLTILNEKAAARNNELAPS